MKNVFKSEFTLSMLFLMILVVIVIGSFYQSNPPRVIPKDAPSDLFSAERAMAHLPFIASKSHSLGTSEHLKVRDYIIDVLRKMGTNPELQLTEVYYPYSYRAATVGNIIVKLPGTDNSKAVLVMGHYDSVEDSYGAADDGSAVATMLETLRVLKTQRPLKNDIVFLFTDGEEAGLLGARAFVEQHPSAKDIGLVMNFEASGTSGQSLMFETSKDNKWIISEFAKAAPYPIANSLNYEIYRNMPNSTDLTPFKNIGVKCLNFAFIENRYDYHTYGDNIRNTNLSSLQHHGYYATALTQHFGNIDLNNSTKGDAVYFNTIGSGFVYYSYRWIIPFAILTIILLLVVLGVGLKRKIIRPLRLLFGFFAFIFALLIAPVIVTCLYFVLVKYYPGNDLRLLYYNYTFLLFAFVSITIAISFAYYKLLGRGIKIWYVLTLMIVILILLCWSGQISALTFLVTLVCSAIIYLLFRKPTSVWELSAGSAIGWAILMISVSIKIPGVSYLFTWPLFCSLIPLGIFFLNSNHVKFQLIHSGLFLIFSMPVIIWFSNLTYLFLIAMGLNMAGGAVLLTVLCLSLLIPNIEIITRTKALIITLVIFSSGLFFLLLGSVNLKYNERFQKSNSIIYANSENNETCWTSFDKKTDEWTENFLTDKPDTGRVDDLYPFDKRNYLKYTIKTIPLPLPDITVISDSIENNERFLKLHLKSGRNTSYLDILIKTDSGGVKAGINRSGMADLNRVNGTDWQYIRYYALPSGGIDLKLQMDRDKKVEIRLIDVIIGLPDFLPGTLKQRPDYMMSRGDRSLVAKSFFY